MKLLLQEIRRNPLLWLLVFVPIGLAAEKLSHDSHTLHFVLSVLAIFAAGRFVESCDGISRGEDRRFGGRSAERHALKSDGAFIAIAALQAGQYTFVKASVTGAIVTNS